MLNMLSGTPAGFSLEYTIFPVAALKKEYTVGSNFSKNSSKLLTSSASLISFILSSLKLSSPLTSPTKVSKLSFSGLISSINKVRLVCFIILSAILHLLKSIFFLYKIQALRFHYISGKRNINNRNPYKTQNQ